MKEPANDNHHASEAALLSEYQAAQLHISAINAVMWQAQAIMWGAAFAGAAILIGTRANLSNAIATTMFALVVAAAIAISRLFWTRLQQSAEIVYARMREIELSVGMRRNLYMDALRQWQSRAQARSYNILGDAERATLENEYPKYSTPSASWLSSDVFPVLIVFGWGILACGKWLDYAL